MRISDWSSDVCSSDLYFDPVYLLTSILADSVSVTVGLSAQSYPFAAPSGIVDFSLRRPADKAGQSFLFDCDSFGRFGVELAGSFQVSQILGLGSGVTFGRSEYPDVHASQHPS